MQGSYVQLIGHKAFFCGHRGVSHEPEKIYKNLMSTYGLKVFLKLKYGFSNVSK